MGLQKILTTSVLASLFIIAIISFGVNLGVDNDTNGSILDNLAINKIWGELNESIINTSESTTSQWEVLQGSDIDTGSDLGLVSIAKTAVSLPKLAWATFKSIFDLISTVLGIPAIVIYSITTLLTIAIVIGIISLIKSGR